jgi:hypothetical protein
VNGNGGGAAIYQSINLSGVLPEGDTFAVCGNLGVPNCDLDVEPGSNLIQNGAPDAVGLRRLGVLEDAVSYDGKSGAPYTEGTGVSPAMSDLDSVPGVGISRTPGGHDTGLNDADFTLLASTPGIPEAAPRGTARGSARPVARGSTAGRERAAIRNREQPLNEVWRAVEGKSIWRPTQSGAKASLAGDPCSAGKVQGTSRIRGPRA